MHRLQIRPRFYGMLIGIIVTAFVVACMTAKCQIAAQEDILAEKQARLDEIDAQIASLNKEISYASSEDFAEEAARDLGYILPGEIRYVAGQ